MMMDESTFTCITALILIVVLVFLVRLINIVPCLNAHQTPTGEKRSDNKRLLILLGSGGHTGEMIRILGQWDKNVLSKFRREYIISSGDSTSVLKLQQLEATLDGEFKIKQVYRARNIGEGKLKAVVNTLLSFKSVVATFEMDALPDVFLSNGPGTSIPISYCLFLLKFIGKCHTKIVYVESLARVKNLSLTGLLILPIANRMIVQWPQLAKRYKRCEYHGILV